MKTKIDLNGLELKNPVMTGSGTFGFGYELEDYCDIASLGALVTTALTYRPRPGNTGRRVYETSGGIMNSIGLENPGIEKFLEEEIYKLEKFQLPIIANLSGSSKDEYLKGLELLNQSSIASIELNISCPNVKEGGMAFGIEVESAYPLVKAVRERTGKHLIVKLSPNCRSIEEMSKCVEEAGADAISLVNTFNALAIDIEKGQPIFDNITAGLSGPAIKPISLRMVREAARAVNIPIIGIGGIVDYRDAIEYIMAGASAIQIGTGNFMNPRASEEIVKGIEDFMERKQIENLEEIRGII